MSVILFLLVVFMLGGGLYTERSELPGAARVRSSRVYQSGRTRIVNTGKALRGRPVVYINGKATPIEDLREDRRPRTSSRPSDSSNRPRPRTPLPYTAPEPKVAEANGSGRPSSGGRTVDFFEAILHVATATYEGPNDALRALRTFGEGSRTWANGLTVLHQRMADPGDMNIDPMVADHVIRAVAYIQAAGLELAESDGALTILLNMSLNELIDRNLRVPNTHR